MSYTIIFMPPLDRINLLLSGNLNAGVLPFLVGLVKPIWLYVFA